MIEGAEGARREEKERKKECWMGMGKSAREEGLLYKAAGRLSRRALPQQAAPTPFRWPLAWKQELAPFLPSLRL